MTHKLGELFNPEIPIPHHPWCNYFYREREGCKMCEGLFRKYPLNDLTPDEMLEKYFPNVKKVG